MESNAAAIGFGTEALEWGRFRFDAKELADFRARTLGVRVVLAEGAGG